MKIRQIVQIFTLRVVEVSELAFFSHPVGGHGSGVKATGLGQHVCETRPLHGIDKLGAFHAAVTIEQGWGPGIGLPDILLAGIHGDSWTYRNDMLVIRDAGQIVGQLRIHDAGSEAFTVADTAACDGTSVNSSW